MSHAEMQDIRIDVHDTRATTATREEKRNRPDRSREIRIEVKKSRRHTAGPLELRADKMPKISSISQDYCYVNSAYVGSTNNVNHVHQPIQYNNTMQYAPPIDTVYREQYCICSRWPFAKKAVVAVAGLLLGAAMSLALGMTLTGRDITDFPMLRGSASPG